MHKPRVASRVAVAVGATLAGLLAIAGFAPAANASTASVNVVELGKPVPFGNAPTLGSMAGRHLNSPIIAMAATPDGKGYWLVSADGGVFGYGSAHYYGSAGNIRLKSPIVGIAAAPDGKGYWLVARDGGIFNYGSAHFYGSAGALHLKAPIVGMAAAPGGKGYWIVGSDGGIFTYGTARFRGSKGGSHLNSPVVGMSAAPAGQGYWLVAADGGIFTFGTAHYYGSAGNIHLVAPIVGMATGPEGKGYWLVATDGGVFRYGTARFKGSLGGIKMPSARIGGLAGTPSGEGYWLLPVPLPPPPPKPIYLTEPSVSEGQCGRAVTLLQEKLLALGYWVDTTGGCFDDSTQQAVWALQKAAGLTRDGVAGPATWTALFKGVLPQTRSTSGYVIEVNLANDLVMFVNNGRIVHILNTSTGGGYTYYENGVANVATTPTGVFNTYYAVNGLVTDSLGQLWRPRYFYSGFAIHGDGYVPPYPVSHGCVRVSNEAIDWIWANNIDPIGTEVWVYN